MLDTKKFHMVSWEKVKVPKERGGLGITDLRCMNKALLGKWIWRFGKETDVWWRELITLKFGLERGSEWWTSCAGTTSGWSIWFWVWKESPLFWELSFVDPGSGERVRFWHDIWVPGKHLVRDYPRVAAAAQLSDAFITDVCVLHDRMDWNIELVYTLRGGAHEELTG
ncbi:Putative ribonuclease H protein At1g65750 [Linum grandiflorum]